MTVKQVKVTLHPTSHNGSFCPVNNYLLNDENIHDDLKQYSVEYVRKIADGTSIMIAKYEGDEDVLRNVLENIHEILSFHIFPDTPDLTVFVHGVPSDIASQLLDVVRENAFFWDGIAYFQGASIQVTLSGEMADITDALDNLPENVALEVNSIGSFSPPDGSLRSILSERQLEVLSLAIERSYYDSPHGVTQEELATELGLGSSTVNEHLRAAERRIIVEYVDAS